MDGRGIILVLLLPLATTITIGPDGGYRDIVVRIQDSVPEDHCHTYIQNIKEMLTEGSGVLSEALAGQAYLAQVTVVIPSNWRDARCHAAIPYPAKGVKYQGGDILLSSDSPVFGSSPHTQQSRGCGMRGDFINIPATFLRDWNKTHHTWGNPGKLFVKEWSKLRYGVFDEHGYISDPIYPNFFKHQDMLLPTGTSDAVVRGVWLHPDGTEGCDPATGACYYDPEGDNEGATCSLNYIPHLPNVKGWCNQTNQISKKFNLSPSKQNILCGARSAKTIISANKDFKNLSGEKQLQRSLIPRFDIVRDPPPKYVLLIETSSAMADKWKWVRKAAQNLIRYVVPDNSPLAVITFNSVARVEHPLVQLTMESARSRMADSIPDSPNKLGQSAEGCVTCGIQVAMEQVLKGKEAGGHIIIITKEHINAFSFVQEENIKSSVLSFGVRVSSIVLGGSAPNPFYPTLADISGGVHRRIVGTESGEKPSLEMFSDLVEGLRDTINKDTKDPGNHPLTIYRQYFYRGDSEPVVGYFEVDAALGRDTEFGVYVEDDEDHQIKSVEFKDDEGKVYGPFTKMSSTYDVVNFKTINYEIGKEPPFDAKRGTRWQYTIEWYDINEKRQNVVTVRSKPSDVGEAGLLVVETWTNHDADTELSSDNLLAIFVKVSRGNSPVLNARVTVKVSVDPSDPLDQFIRPAAVATNAGPIQLDQLLLIDNGYGEPDLTSGDGIYSRYVTQYPATGKYTYKVYVDDNGGAAATVTPGPAVVFKPEKPGINTCCGSRVPIPADRTRPIGLFRRTAEGPAVAVTSLPAANKIRPGKIGDFSVSVLGDTQRLVAHWTAPGGDFNDGAVMTYRFVFSEKVTDMLTPSVSAPALDGLKRSDPAGSDMTKEINFEYYGADYYVGIYAFDEAGNRGTMSNLVIVNVPPPPTVPLTNGTMQPILKKKTTDWTLIGAIIGAIGVLLLVLVVSLYCHFCRTSRSKFSKSLFASSLRSSGVKVQIPSPTQSENTDSSSYESDLKGMGGSTLTNNIKHPKVSSTSFGNNITPTYWSASQLLSEHEIRSRDLQHDIRSPRDIRSHDLDPRDVINYDPSSQYDAGPGYAGSQSGGVYTGSQSGGYPANQYDGGYYREDLQNYNDQYYDQYNPRQRYSTTSVEPEYPMYYHDPALNHALDSALDHALNKSSQRLVNSDLSSSTLGITNPSLLGSQMSLNSSQRNKNRNITQV